MKPRPVKRYPNWAQVNRLKYVRTLFGAATQEGLARVGQAARLRQAAIPTPLGWERANLTRDYAWRRSRKIDENKYRPMRDFKDR